MRTLIPLTLFTLASAASCSTPSPNAVQDDALSIIYFDGTATRTAPASSLRTPVPAPNRIVVEPDQTNAWPDPSAQPSHFLPSYCHCGVQFDNITTQAVLDCIRTFLKTVIEINPNATYWARDDQNTMVAYVQNTLMTVRYPAQAALVNFAKSVIDDACGINGQGAIQFQPSYHGGVDFGIMAYDPNMDPNHYAEMGKWNATRICSRA